MTYPLIIDGTMPGDVLDHSPEAVAPFYVFNADAQEHVSGPHATRGAAERALRDSVAAQPSRRRRLARALRHRWMDSHLAAFVLGFRDMQRGEFGRTHEASQDWNESYDQGGNAAEWWSVRPFGPRPFDGSSYQGR